MLTSKKMIKVMEALMQNSKMSDKEIANLISTSQSTVGRQRNRLVKRGFIKAYTLVPDLRKLGYTIISVSTMFADEDTVDTVLNDKNIFFALTSVSEIFVVSRHKTIDSFNAFKKRYSISDDNTNVYSVSQILKDPVIQTL